MRRRDLLSGAAASAGMLTCPGWIARAFAQSSREHELVALSDAYRRAARSARPLLVLVVPEDEGTSSVDRAGAFGELLNHCGEEIMALLAITELACARMPTLRTLVPHAAGGQPLMVLVETDSVPGRVSQLDAELAISDYWHGDVGWEERERLLNEAIDQRIAALSQLVRAALAPDDEVLERRAARARTILDASEIVRLDELERGGEPDVEIAVRAPAAVLALARERPELTPLLAQIAIERWRRGRVPGSRWAISGGCGVHYEETQAELEARGGVRSVFGCGMGHAPERSRRFLSFFGPGSE